MTKWFLAVEYSFSLTISIAGAIFATWVLQYHYGGYTEILSECLCWALVALWAQVFPRFYAIAENSDDEGKRAAGNLSWLIAIGLTTASLLKSVDDTRWIVVCLSLCP